MQPHVATRSRAVQGAASILLTLLAILAHAAEPELDVKARFPTEPTGTMHFAEALTFSIGSARPLHLESEDSWLPIPGPHLRVSASRFLLLGWSSTGSGMQSLHVLSLGIEDGGVALTGELILTTDRMSAGLLLRPGDANGMRIGVPRPPLTYLHDPEEWSLNLGGGKGEHLSLDEMRALHFEAVVREKEDVFYAPPFEDRPFPTRVAWIRLTPSGHFESATVSARR